MKRIARMIMRTANEADLFRGTVERTLKASTLNSRRSERPAVRGTGGASTLKGSPMSSCDNE